MAMAGDAAAPQGGGFPPECGRITAAANDAQDGAGSKQKNGSGAEYAHLYVFTAEKGGMAGCDKELQQKVIAELSEGSKHFEHARQQDAKVDLRIQHMQDEVRNITRTQRAALERQAAQMVQAAEASRDLSRWCCVVDMDMFYAAVELRDQPHLAEKPVAVGGMGMISTANYVARRYGVRSAMPGFIAKELCRRQGVELVFVRPNFTKYTAEAETIRDVIGQYGQFEAHSLDEAYVDITDVVRSRARAGGGACSSTAAPHSAQPPEAPEAMRELSGPDSLANNSAQSGDLASEEAAAAAVMEEMRAKIKERTRGLTASAGAAPNFALAKMAADERKPDGQFLVPRTRDALLAWLHPKPIRKIGGVGKVSEKMVKALGGETVGDVARLHAELLVAFPGVRSEWFIARSLGISSTSLEVYDEGDGVVRRKSISNERTFRDLSDADVLMKMLKDLCNGLAEEMAKEGLAGKTVTVKLKRSTFEVVTRAHSAKRWLSSAADIHEVAQEIFRKEFPCCLRLLGVRVSSFRNAAEPVAEDPQQAKLQRFFGAGGGGSSSSRAPSSSAQEADVGDDRRGDEEPPPADAMDAADAKRGSDAAMGNVGEHPAGGSALGNRAPETILDRLSAAGARDLKRPAVDKSLWEVPCFNLDDEDEEAQPTDVPQDQIQFDQAQPADVSQVHVKPAEKPADVPQERSKADVAEPTKRRRLGERAGAEGSGTIADFLRSSASACRTAQPPVSSRGTSAWVDATIVVDLD